MDQSKVGFAVVYRWRLHPGREDVFREAWDVVTRALMDERGAQGSRLYVASFSGTPLAKN